MQPKPTTSRTPVAPALFDTSALVPEPGIDYVQAEEPEKEDMCVDPNPLKAITGLIDTDEATIRDYAVVALSCTRQLIVANCFIDKVAWEATENEACLTTAQRVNKIHFTALCVVCCAAKPITSINREYVNKRWSTAINMSGRAQTERPTGICSSEDDFVASVSLAAQYLNIKNVTKCIQRVHPQPFQNALFKQLRLVYSGHGMTSILWMKGLVEAAQSKVLLIPVIASQAVAFKRAMLRLVQIHGEKFPYLRLTDPDSLSTLDTIKFSDLHVAAIEWATVKGHLPATGAFNRTTHATTITIIEIKKAVSKSIRGDFTMTNETMANLNELGINAREVNRKRYRKTSDSEDEEQL